jgi:Chlorophyllase enzyme
LHADRLPQGTAAPALNPRSLDRDASGAAQGTASVVRALWVVGCLAVLVGAELDLPKAFAQGDRVYVDQAYTGAIEDGSAAHPFREFTVGARNVARGGHGVHRARPVCRGGDLCHTHDPAGPGVVLSGPRLAGCPIAWGPTVLTPVFYGIQDFDPRGGAPGPLRVFYPTIDGAVHEAPLLRNCGRYPLVVFLHGHCPQAMEYYRAWVHLPAQLARSGYVVVVPQLPGISAGTPPFTEASTDLTLVENVLAWVRREWAHRDQLMLPPATGIVGHSYGALLGGRLATSIAASAFVSLSGGWTEWSGPLPRPLGALHVPALLTWEGQWRYLCRP